MSPRSPFLRSALVLAATILIAGCQPSEVGTIGSPESKGPETDPSAPVVKGGQVQPPVKVRGKSVSAREALGIGR
ncbi:hypothetical protein [Paludisphaera soli]|uniref:hypothetical protein n=1 Tax=Paludisphaera soli TaxID=2712865 RepID=UPI0013EDD81F|nr:hypothetical protein [Paludisphaera soli]